MQFIIQSDCKAIFNCKKYSKPFILKFPYFFVSYMQDKIVATAIQKYRKLIYQCLYTTIFLVIDYYFYTMYISAQIQEKWQLYEIFDSLLKIATYWRIFFSTNIIGRCVITLYRTYSSRATSVNVGDQSFSNKARWS